MTSRKVAPGALNAQIVGVCARGEKSHPQTQTCLGGSKSRHAGGLVVDGTLDAMDGRVVGMDGLGVGEGVDGQDQLKISRVHSSEQFT